MATFKSQPDHYDVIKNIEDPIVTWEGLTNYEGSIRTRLDLKTDKTETEALTNRVAKDEGDIDNLEATKEDKTVVTALTGRVSDVEANKADKTELAKTNRNLEEVNNKATHNATDIANLHDDIEGVTNQYTVLTNSLSTLQTKFGELNAYSGKVDVLQGDISDLWDQVNAGGIGGGGSGGGGGVEPSTGDYYTKTESNSRFALKTSLNSYLTKSEAERTYAQNAEIEALKKQIERLEEQLQPMGTIHVNINTSKNKLATAIVAVRHSYDNEMREGKYMTQQEKALVNGETTFTNLKKGDYEVNFWKVGYKKAWDANPENVKNLSNIVAFNATTDTEEFTELPYARLKFTNNTGIDFAIYTITSSSKQDLTFSSGFGHSDKNTNEWINDSWENSQTKERLVTESGWFETDYYIHAITKDKTKKYVSPPFNLTFGDIKEITATKGEVITLKSGDQGDSGPEIMADSKSDLAAMREELEVLRAQLNAALNSQKQVDPSGGEGPSI